MLQISCITVEDILNIEQSTRGQSTSRRWHEEHQKRITASNFGKICKAKRVDMDQLARSLIQRPTLHTGPILRGKKYESVALEKFEGATGLKTAKCGLFVNREHPYLAASPDAVFGQTIPVEIKCPFVSRNKNIDTVTVPYLMQNDGPWTVSTIIITRYKDK